MARIELNQVTKSWGDVNAVETTDLSIGDGELVAILGPSGCGKSTTLFMLAGIYAPTSGEIRFDDFLVNDVEARHRNVGIVFQSYALYPHMSVQKNIMFPLKFRGMKGAVAENKAREAARLVHVEELLDRMPSQMSGGQQQRVALARALVKEPQLLLLDEPLSNLDATLRLSMRSEIKKLQRQLGVTTILVTHDQIEATTMADRIICMSKGKIEQIGTADDLYEKPDGLFIASFIGSPPINLLTGTARSGTVQLGSKSLGLPGLEGDVVIGIRPETVGLVPGGEDGEILQIEPMGRETLYLVDSAFGELRALEGGASKRFSIGDRVSLKLDPEKILAFDARTERRIKDVAIAIAA